MVSSGRRVVSGAAARSGTRGAFDRGTCPVCRAPNIPLRVSSGKIMPHGRSAAAPQGCAGTGEAPYRERKQRPGVLPVADIRGEQVPHDQAPEPDLGIEVLVERRDGEVPVHLRPPPPGAA